MLLQQLCWFFTLLSLGLLPYGVLAALDPNGVPYPDDVSVVMHQAQQARLKGIEHRERAGKSSPSPENIKTHKASQITVSD